jgi:hypothetical protein
MVTTVVSWSRLPANGPPSTESVLRGSLPVGPYPRTAASGEQAVHIIGILIMGPKYPDSMLITKLTSDTGDRLDFATTMIPLSPGVRSAPHVLRDVTCVPQGAATPFLSSAGQFTITVKGSATFSCVVARTKNRWPSGAA